MTTASVFHVDAINGSDSNDGSAAAPYQTLAPVMPQLTGGDTVYLYDGNYGSIRYLNTNSDIFTDWVEITAAEGTSPVLDSFLLHRNGAGAPGGHGIYDAYLSLSGIHIRGHGYDYAVTLIAARHVRISDCLIEVEGPWVGTEDNIQKTGVTIKDGNDITIQNCEITRVGVGFKAKGHDVNILYNDIHDITHDGIIANGLVDSLVEGNFIRGLDDGVEDFEEDWNKHCDAIHIQVYGSTVPELLVPNHNVVFRGNVIYNIEAQAIQFNNYGSAVNNEIVFENNIFGPVKASYQFNDAEPVEGLVLRNNSFIYLPGGTTYVNPNNATHRTLICPNHGVRITEATTDLEIYNNILVHGASIPITTADVFENNVLIMTPSSPAFTGNPSNIATEEEQFLNPSAIDGVLRNTSWAINHASQTYPLYGYDIYGTARGPDPEAGAVEFSGPALLQTIGTWRLDNSADDSSGNGFDGTVVGGASFSTDRVIGSHSLYCDGVNDAMVVPDAPALRVQGDLTVAGWIKPSTSSGNRNLLSKSFNDGYRLRVTNSNQLQLILGIPGSGSHQVVGANTSSAVIVADTWQHVATTVYFAGGQGLVEFYVDGVLVGTDTVSVSGIEAGTDDLVIGAGTAVTLAEKFTGLIDDVRVYDFALTQNEILDLIGPGAAPVLSPIDDPIVNTSASFLLRATAEDADGDPMVMSVSGLPGFGSFVDHANGRADLQFDPQPGDEGSYPMTVSVSDGVNVDSENFTLNIVPADARGQWRFDFDPSDNSGWNHHAVLDGGAGYSTDSGEGVGSLSLSGGSHAEVADSAPLRVAGDLTLVAMVKPSQLGSNQNLVAKSYNDGYRLRLTSTNQIQLIIGVPSGGVAGATSSGASLAVGVWQRIVVTVSFNGSVGTVNYYVDGVPLASKTVSTPGIETGTGPLVIGAANSSGIEAFNGLIDDVRVYPRALSPSEVAGL